jgi:hypothetical protein
VPHEAARDGDGASGARAGAEEEQGQAENGIAQMFRLCTRTEAFLVQWLLGRVHKLLVQGL